jgi:hypothetical protein
VASMWVRYENGDTDEWRLTDAVATDLNDFATRAQHCSAVDDVFGFPVTPEEGTGGTDFGWVCLSMSKVVAWHLDGLVNPAAAAALWVELEGPGEPPEGG